MHGYHVTSKIYRSLYILYNALIFIQNVIRGDINQPLCDMTLDLTQSTNHIIVEHSLLSLADFEEVRISFIISIVSWNYLVPFYDQGSFYILYGNHSDIIYIQCFILRTIKQYFNNFIYFKQFNLKFNCNSYLVHRVHCIFGLKATSITFMSASIKSYTYLWFGYLEVVNLCMINIWPYWAEFVLFTRKSEKYIKGEDPIRARKTERGKFNPTSFLDQSFIYV